MKTPKVTVGIISFKDQKYLKHGLPSLEKQDYKNFQIIICDNNQDPKNTIKKWVEKSFPNIQVVSAGGNVGFGNAHNFMINLAKKNKSKYYFAFNSDMFADPKLISELVKLAESKEEISAISPKLLKWSTFPKKPNKKNEQRIDSTGIIATQSHHFFERGTGETDQGQYNEVQEIWGVSGAAPFYKIAALEDIAHSPNEYFDKNFFMYKEDIDLSYRLRWAGHKIFYQPTALVWHDRTASEPGSIIANIKERKKRSAYIKEHSFLNHFQLLHKNFSQEYNLTTKLKTKLFNLKYLLYLLIFDRAILKQYKKYKKLKAELSRKRATMPKRISAKQMESWFI